MEQIETEVLVVGAGLTGATASILPPISRTTCSYALPSPAFNRARSADSSGAVGACEAGDADEGLEGAWVTRADCGQEK